MAIDGIILHQLHQEMIPYFPAKINKIQQISDTEIIFTLRTRIGVQKLMISTHSVYNRIHFTSRQYTTLETPGNFVMLLRKLLDGGIILAMDQMGLDRILDMRIEARNELGDIHEFHLYLEFMGKYANMVLVNAQGKIVDAMKRIPPFENNKRTIHPGAIYALPTPHQKKNPFVEFDGDFDDPLTKQYHGFSPLLSTEIQYRIHAGEIFEDIMHMIAHSHQMYITSSMQFHVLPLTHLHTSVQTYSLMEGLDVLYYEKEEKVRIKQQSGDLFKVVKHEYNRNHTKLPKLKESLKEAHDCERFRIYGDLLFAYMHKIKREKIIELPSFETGELVQIPIDMRYDIKQNANKYYQKYHKLKRAQLYLQEQIAQCKKELHYFEGLKVQLEQASVQDAMEIREELSRLGYMKARIHKIRKKKKSDIPHYLSFRLDDVFVYVGKNNVQNEYITWKLAKKSDTWLHVKDLHGSHVIITTSDPCEQLLRDAAMLAAWFSSGRYSSSVPVNYCMVKQLKKIPGNKGSFVSLSTYKTIYIDPDSDHIIDLLKHQIKQ